MVIKRQNQRRRLLAHGNMDLNNFFFFFFFFTNSLCMCFETFAWTQRYIQCILVRNTMHNCLIVIETEKHSLKRPILVSIHFEKVKRGKDEWLSVVFVSYTLESKTENNPVSGYHQPVTVSMFLVYNIYRLSEPAPIASFMPVCGKCAMQTFSR